MITASNNTSNVSDALLDATWKGFVITVLEVTIEAYKKMFSVSTELWREKWEENTFSANLSEHMKAIKFAKELPWHVELEGPVITAEIRQGQRKLKEAEKTDIRVINVTTRPPERFFVFECKLLSDKYKVRKRNLTRAYVDHGIKRFVVQEVYSDSLPDAGMIGYVLAGTPDVIAAQINERIVQTLTASEQLKRNSNTQFDFKDLFLSEHRRRKSKTQLHIHHLFLTVDLPKET